MHYLILIQWQRISILLFWLHYVTQVGFTVRMDGVVGVKLRNLIADWSGI